MARTAVKKQWKKGKTTKKWASKKTRRYPRKGGGQPTGGMPGMPNGKTVKMIYVDPVQYLNSPTGLQSINTYMINSIYDPNVTGVGAQPLSHDEFATFYNQYIVTGAKITTTFNWQTHPIDEAQVYYPAVCFAFTDEDTTAPTTLSTKMERYPNKYKILRPGDTNGVSVTNYFSAKRFFKVDDITADHQLRAVFTSNPQKPAYCNVVVQSLDAGTDCGYVLTTTKIDYIVKLIDPKPILGS